MKVLATVLAIIAPMPALALSCLPHSLEATYQRAAESAETYMVVHGRLTFDAGKMPRMNVEQQQNTPQITEVDAVLRGRSLAAPGFTVPFDQNLTLRVRCFGPWCASAKSGQDVLAFVQREGDSYSVRLNPCGGDMFGAPQSAMITRVKNCFNAGSCAPPAQ